MASLPGSNFEDEGWGGGGGVESLISYALYLAKGHIFQFDDQTNGSHHSHLIMQYNAATLALMRLSREGPCISAWGCLVPTIFIRLLSVCTGMYLLYNRYGHAYWYSKVAKVVQHAWHQTFQGVTLKITKTTWRYL